MNQLALPENMKFLGKNSRYAVESLWTEISQAAAKGATQLQLFLQGRSEDWILTETLKDNLHHWQRIYQTVTLVIDKQTTLDDIIKEDLWVLQRLGVQIATIEASKINAKNAGYIIAQTLTETNKNYKTFASADKTMAIPTQNWLTEKESLVVYAQDYPVIVLSEYLNAEQLKPQTHSGDVEIEIHTECNGALTQFADKFWQLLLNSHPALQQHINKGDELASISYSDAYLYSPWTVLLLTEIIDGLRQQLKHNWNKPSIEIHSKPKQTNNRNQRRTLFADWLDDSARSNVIKAYFEIRDETCIIQLSNNIAHGRVMQLTWKTGAVTNIRFDQGMGYWYCDVRHPNFDNQANPLEQADTMLELIPKLKLKNQKDFPTQVFIKERNEK